jgi:membrane-bound ClpP family serine protease
MHLSAKLILPVVAAFTACGAMAQTPATPVPYQTAAPAKPNPLADAQARIAELEAQLARQTQAAGNAHAEVVSLRTELALKDELLTLGLQRNAELYAIATEVVDKGLSRKSEPFLQTQRVKMENMKQDYEDRLRAARIYPTTLAPSVQQHMDADLGKAPGGAPDATPVQN